MLAGVPRASRCVYHRHYTEEDASGAALPGGIIKFAVLAGCLFFAGTEPRFQAPAWWRHVPFITAGLGALFFLLNAGLYWGQGVFLAGLALLAWGGRRLRAG